MTVYCTLDVRLLLLRLLCSLISAAERLDMSLLLAPRLGCCWLPGVLSGPADLLAPGSRLLLFPIRSKTTYTVWFDCNCKTKGHLHWISHTLKLVKKLCSFKIKDNSFPIIWRSFIMSFFFTRLTKTFSKQKLKHSFKLNWIWPKKERWICKFWTNELTKN